MNPYEILGVPTDATAMQIKVAYRKLAHKLHPDRPSGDKEAFTLVGKAYEILSDENKRAYYDRTGKVEEDTTNYEASASQTLRNLFSMAIDNGVSDVLGWSISQLEGSLGSMASALQSEKNKFNRIRKYHNRLVLRGDGENLFTQVLEEKLKCISNSIKVMETGKKVTTTAIEKVKEYENGDPCGELLLGGGV